MTRFQQLLQFNQNVQHLWGKLSDSLEEDGHLTRELKEEVRKTLAQQNGCLYCQAKGKPNAQHVDEKTAVAVGYAEAFLHGKGQTPETVTAVLDDYFTQHEKDELLAFICFMTASQYLGALQGLEPYEGLSNDVL